MVHEENQTNSRNVLDGFDCDFGNASQKKHNGNMIDGMCHDL
jgi:hypothetical protein